MSDCVVILSGGMDSTCLVYWLVEQGYEPLCLSFNYGQRHAKELEYASMTCDKLGLDYSRVDLSSVTELLAGSGSVLVDVSTPVPEGHYAHDNMSQTVVPNRNMIMLSIATGACVAKGGKFVATGVHGGDHYQYPDCRPGFIAAMDRAIIRGNEGFSTFDHKQLLQEDYPRILSAISAPFLYATKADIAHRAWGLAMPFQDTWSCYKGGDVHCGKCGTCVERLEAIDVAAKREGLSREDFDDTEYEDEDYWKLAVKEYTV